MPRGDLLEVLALEGRVLGVGQWGAGDEGVDLGDDLGVLPGLGDEGGGDEGRALGEEAEDVQAGQVEEAVVEVGRFGGEAALGVSGGPA